MADNILSSHIFEGKLPSHSNDPAVPRLLAALMGLTGSGGARKRLEIGAVRGSLEELGYGDFGLGEMNFSEVVRHFGQQ